MGAVKSGDSFGFNASTVYGPASGFDGNTPIVGSLTYFETSLEALGFDETEIANGGTLSGAGGTVNWTATVVPEPSTYAGIFGCIALGFAVIRRKRV
jgi:hypothetical protein